MKYYLVSLNNNECVNKSRIKDVILLQDVCGHKIYENVEILAYETGKFISSHLIDVISGKEINSNGKGLSYLSKIPISGNDLKRIENKYNNLTIEEIIRYKKGILEIERNSITI